MQLLSHEMIRFGAESQTRYWRVAIPVMFAVLAVLWIGPQIETRYFPVIEGVSIRQRLPGPGLRFTINFDKVRDCPRISTTWRAGTPDKPSGRVYITIPEKQYGTGGAQSYVQEIEITPKDAPTFFGVSKFACGLPWATRQVIGPFDNWTVQREATQ